MGERYQRKETVVEGFAGNKTGRHRLAEYRQPVEPFQGSDDGILGQRVPHHPVTIDAGGKDQPDQRHAREPGEPARATIAPQDEFAQQVQHHHHHQRIGSVTVQAAHDAAEVPLFVREVFDRGIG